MRFQADHSNTPLIKSFDGHTAHISQPAAQAGQDPDISAHSSSFLLSARTGQVQAWPVAQFAALTAEHFEAIAAFAPQVVVFGSGDTLRFAPAALSRSLTQAHIGMETMGNAAACRTFNVLSAEGRDVLLALLLEAPAAP